MVDPSQLEEIDWYRDPDSGKFVARDPATGDTFPLPLESVSVGEQLDVPVYSDDSNAPSNTHYFNDSDGQLKFKDADGTVHSGGSSGGGVSNPLSEDLDANGHAITNAGSLSTEKVVSESGIFGIRNALDYPGDSGGERIQNAINDLPNRGGTVFIPPVGPDDGVTNGNGNTEDGVWVLTSPISTGGKHGVNIVGAGAGWGGNNSGTSLICTDSSVGTMVTMDGGFLDSIRDIRIDAAGNATTCLDLGGGASTNDYQANRVMAHHATGDGIRLTGDKNFWLDNCWSEIHDGAGIAVDIVSNSVWITNHLSYDNRNAIEVQSNVAKMWVQNLRSALEREHGILINGPVSESFFDNIHMYGPGDSAAATYNAVEIKSGLTKTVFRTPFFDGNSAQTQHGINLDSASGGSVTEMVVTDLLGDPGTLAGGPVKNVRDQNDSNATRTLINGVGFNEGDPRSTGTWNARPRDGVFVRDMTNSNTYIFHAGEWSQIASE